MFKIKNYIEQVGEDRKINDNLKVENNIIYLTLDNTQFKYERGNWHQYTTKWVNLQGGVPYYTSEINLDNLLFDSIEEDIV